ncbi:MAG: hypothetical protein ACE5JX_00985 [Acidobacteriota bacterium]
METRRMIELLETELDLIEKGGYERSVREPWRPRSMFQYSVACINHWLVPEHSPETCEGCMLLDFVPEEHRHENAPCHFIPLNEAGETVSSLRRQADRDRLEEAVKGWLRATLRRLKEEEAPLGPEKPGSETLLY